MRVEKIAKHPSVKVILDGRVSNRQGKNPIFKNRLVQIRLPLNVHVDEFNDNDRDLYVFVLKKLFKCEIDVLETHGNDGVPKYVFNTAGDAPDRVSME